MAWVVGSPLVADLSELQELTGAQDLANLQTDSVDAVVNALTSASDQWYWRIKRDGIDPNLLTNEEAYKPAVAEHTLALLVKRGYLHPPEGQAAPVDPFEWSEPLARRVGPEISEGDQPPRLGATLPRAHNINRDNFGQKTETL
jgi:hypothetical protein